MDARSTNDEGHYAKRTRLVKQEYHQPTYDSSFKMQSTLNTNNINIGELDDEIAWVPSSDNGQLFIRSEARSRIRKDELARALTAKIARRQPAEALATTTAKRRYERKGSAALGSKAHRYDRRTSDQLASILELHKPNATDLLHATLSCIKTLHSQRDYELEQQEHAKLKARHIIQSLERQADHYRMRYLTLRQANDKLRAANGLPPKADNYDNDDDNNNDNIDHGNNDHGNNNHGNSNHDEDQQ